MIFGPAYAHAYDYLYANRDYEGDVVALLKEFKDLKLGRRSRVLDYGCGSGRHIEILQSYGLDVVGVDASDAMLERARGRLGDQALLLRPEELHAMNIAFDAAYSLFDVLSYQTTLTAASSFFQHLASRVRSGGLVVLDAWHLPGMIESPPAVRSSSFAMPDGRVVKRSVQPSVNWLTSSVDLRISFQLEEEQASSEGESRSTEIHSMRAFTSLELELLCAASGLVNPKFFGDWKRRESLSSSDWHITLVAEKA